MWSLAASKKACKTCCLWGAPPLYHQLSGMLGPQGLHTILSANFPDYAPEWIVPHEEDIHVVGIVMQVLGDRECKDIFGYLRQNHSAPLARACQSSAC